jgi:hypothetical protein
VAKKVYRLDVKVGAKWQRVCTIEAESHSEAMRQAIACLPPEHFDKPIRLTQRDGEEQQGKGASGPPDSSGPSPV